MNSTVIANIARFILLLAAQVIIFNNMDLWGFITPFPYVLFIMLYPVDGNKLALLATAFLLGLMVDMFGNSGGVHAAACVILAYVRPAIFKFSFGLSYEYQTIKINDVLTPERFSFILLSVVIHHAILFVLEIWFVSIWGIFLRTICSTIFTIILSIILIYIFKPSRR